CRCLAAVGGRGDAPGRGMPVRVTREKGSGALERGEGELRRVSDGCNLEGGAEALDEADFRDGVPDRK
ncbi:MAG: hypothetical protein WBV82_00650, partial [Myxococcaceae bacterium]